MKVDMKMKVTLDKTELSKVLCDYMKSQGFLIQGEIDFKVKTIYLDHPCASPRVEFSSVEIPVIKEAKS